MPKRTTVIQYAFLTLAVIVLVFFAVTVFSKPTGRPTPTIRSTDPYLGKSNADVTMVVFTDFECEYCKSEVATLKEVLSLYQDQIRFVHKDYPLVIHRNARRAAEIGRCAQDQDRFWQMYDVLFAHQAELATVSLETLAKEADADAVKLASCMERQETKNRVDESILDAQSMGIADVPTIFINEQQFTGVTESSTLRQAIFEELQ